MRVLITGAAGRIGSGVAASLRAAGHQVVGLDVVPAPPPPLSSAFASFVQCNLNAAASAGEARQTLLEAARGVDTVIHCAAWPGPSSTPPPGVTASGCKVASHPIGLESPLPEELLRDNVASTAAVCDAAVAGGAKRFVFSSSAFALGWSHAAVGEVAYVPKYLPVDEAHGALPFESYGLSKLLGEQILETSARTAKETGFVSLRFTNIVKRELWHTLPWEPPTPASPLTLLLWAYTHEDDVIDAHVAAATLPGAAAAGSHEAYILAADDTRFAAPTLPTLASVLGVRDLPLHAPMEGNASPFSSLKAKQRLGFRPRSWQSPPTAPPPPPEARRGSAAARRARGDSALRHFDLSDFPLQRGGVLPRGASLAYRVYGQPLGRGAGVILHPTSFDAVHAELEYNIGSGATLDTDAYTVIVPNLMGNGVSFSPSTSGGGWPQLVTVADNVAAQRKLLQHLGVDLDASPLELIYGYSMGALQAYEWSVAYPAAVRRIAAVCGASRCGELNAVFLRSLEAALTADPAWDEASRAFRSPPHRGLRAFASIYAGWGVGSEWYLEQRYRAAGYASAEEFISRSYIAGFASCDAADLLAQVATWRTADVALPHGGLKQALSRVTAKVLLMPCDTDRYFTLEEAKVEAALLGDRCTLVPIRSAAGHRAGDPHRPELTDELAFIKQHVHKLLDAS
ncbi:hypothetical protein AB1Y20_018301 [Prymnesium parvum]|uniref:AB hydrolase-1 domain-containing protein n=1 Tax=Prymnesium parvum TaxID=97485 RepID=A0AB34JRC2_PRYPA